MRWRDTRYLTFFLVVNFRMIHRCLHTGSRVVVVTLETVSRLRTSISMLQYTESHDVRCACHEGLHWVRTVRWSDFGLKLAATVTLRAKNIQPNRPGLIQSGCLHWKSPQRRFDSVTITYSHPHSSLLRLPAFVGISPANRA